MQASFASVGKLSLCIGGMRCVEQYRGGIARRLKLSPETQYNSHKVRFKNTGICFQSLAINRGILVDLKVTVTLKDANISLILWRV